MNTPKKYHSIFLIIDNDSTIFYKNFHLLWKTYMKKEDDILCIFLRMKEDLTKMEEYDEKEQILYFKGKEEYIPGILYKTIKGIQYVLKNFEFQYLTRTNLSSFWHFQNYKNTLTKLPTEKLCLGNIGFYPQLNTLFMSGAGITLSKDVVEELSKNNRQLNYMLIDDVSIGHLLKKMGYEFIESQRNDIILDNYDYDLKERIDGGAFHFRIKNKLDDKRNHFDIEYYYKLITITYPNIHIYQEDDEFITSFYGNQNDWICVNHIMKNIINEKKKVIIDNNLMGKDPIQFVPKKCIIVMKNQTIILDEGMIFF
jgi:hypothetical protein